MAFDFDRIQFGLVVVCLQPIVYRTQRNASTQHLESAFSMPVDLHRRAKDILHVDANFGRRFLAEGFCKVTPNQ